jgi:hypothetical protein
MERGWLFCPKCGNATPEGIVKSEAEKAGDKRAELIEAVRRLMAAEKQAGHAWRGDELEALLWTIADADFSDGLDTHSDQELGVYDFVGGGRYGGRLGGRRNLVARGGGSQGPGGTEAAVTAGLRWLARHQSSDGAWSCSAFSSHCAGSGCAGAGGKDYDVGCTGLALLAFLGAGYTHLSREVYVDPHSGNSVEWGEVIRNGIKWLIANQAKDGCLDSARGARFMYGHVIATMALTEAYGITGNVLLKEPAQRGVNFIRDSRNPGMVWRYSTRCGDNDTSVTCWCVLALKAAATAGLEVGSTGFEAALAWFEEATDERDWKTGYDAPGKRGIPPARADGDWAAHESLTAAALTCRILIRRKRNDPAVEGGLKLLLADLPDSAPRKVDYTYWHFGSLALFQYDSPDGASWKTWNEPMKTALLPLQKTRDAGCAEGSWDPDDDPWGAEGGRIYASAMNVLTLETYYRFPNVLPRKK